MANVPEEMAHRMQSTVSRSELLASVTQEIAKSGVLGLQEVGPAQINEEEVGGLDLLKAWFKSCKIGSSDGNEPTNGVLSRSAALIGMPGTGKSLSAMMLSALWKLPLLRLDVGALSGCHLGERGEKMGRALRMADAVAPCVLWIDDMEYAFPGCGAGSPNSSAATHLFGTFLAWMHERTAPVFVIGTARDPDYLPQELFCSFDRTFLLDLPNDQERREIFTIHLKRSPECFVDRKVSLDELVTKSRGMVGWEIGQAVFSARYMAFDANRAMKQEDLLTALSEVVPLSVSKPAAEQLEKIRKWKAEGRAFPASREPLAEVGQKQRVLEKM